MTPTLPVSSPATFSAPIVGIISLIGIGAPVTAVSTIALVARVAVIAAPAIVRSIIATVSVGRIQTGTIVAPVALLRHSAVPACLILQPLSIAGIHDVVQSANHVIHALGGFRTCTRCHRQQSN